MARDLEMLIKDIEAEAKAFGPEAVKRNEEFQARYAFANQLIEARKARGLTQKQLAELSGIEQPMISNYERGRGNPTLETMTVLSRSLGGRGVSLLS